MRKLEFGGYLGSKFVDKGPHELERGRRFRRGALSRGTDQVVIRRNAYGTYLF